MKKSEFDKFVQRKLGESAEIQQLDAEQELKEWRQYLETLYKDINGYMAPYIASRAARIDYQDIELNEEFSGPYVVPQMLLHIGRSVITFKPVGTMLIGTKGRVDIHGPRDKARLTLIDKQVEFARQLIKVRVLKPGDANRPSSSTENNGKIEWVWKIVTAAPEIRLINLTQESFFEMIIAVADA